MRIAVVGGTGVVGAHVVAAARQAGHEPVVLARSHGVDVTNRADVDGALDGVTVLIDAGGIRTASRRRSVRFFTKATASLLDAAYRAGVEHYVALSIVGIDRVDFGYYEGKRRQEELVRGGPLAHTILRTTQFHEFPGQLLDGARGPVALIPRMRVAPVAAVEVASALLDLACGHAVGMAPELAGPEVSNLTDMARRIVAARSGRRVVVPVRLPGAVGRAMIGDALLPTAPGPCGELTFSRWLSGPEQ